MISMEFVYVLMGAMLAGVAIVCAREPRSSSTRPSAGSSPPGCRARARSTARTSPTPTASSGAMRCILDDDRARSGHRRGEAATMNGPRRPTLDRAAGEGAEGAAPRDRQLAGATGRAAVGGLRDLAGRPARPLGAPGHAGRAGAEPRRRRSAIATGTRAGFVAGVALAHLAFWLDHVDGQVARWRGTASLDGVYFDYLMHHAANLGLGFGLGYGLAARTGDLRWAAAGFAIALGWAVLEPAQRLPLQGVLPAPEARDRDLPRRRRQRRPALAPRPLAATRPARPDLARLQGVRAARRPDRPHGASPWLALVAPAVWLSLWRWRRPGHGRPRPAARLGRVGRAVRRRSVSSGVRPLVPALARRRAETGGPIAAPRPGHDHGRAGTD